MRPRPGHHRTLMAASLLAVAALSPQQAAADGALAVGQPKDVAAEGFAYSFGLNKPSTADANAKALADCRTPTPGVDKRAQAACTVAQTFHNRCFAVAMDPKAAATPGVGWAVADSKDAAGRDALAKCAAAAGESRGDACQVTHSDRDGGAH